MTIDKDLFLYDLAIVAIVKNEGHYIKEWIDYHLMAGVDHFFLYDNESTDNQSEVVKPYVEAGLVDYFYIPGKTMQLLVYNEAVKKFKFFCRYMAFLDCDEFILPKSNKSIVEIVDEVLSNIPNASGLAINWQVFGSNGLREADYSQGVLERFTRRAPKNWTPNNFGNAHCKTIANPRGINFMRIPHHAIYFDSLYAVNENGKLVPKSFNNPVTVEKISVNHYILKSWKEYFQKAQRGRPDTEVNFYNMEYFNKNDRNEEFDDSILRYRETRKKTYQPPDKISTDERVLNILNQNLRGVSSNESYHGQLEKFLVCRALCTKLKDQKHIKKFESESLEGIINSVSGDLQFFEIKLLVKELPTLLKLPYSITRGLRRNSIQIISRVMEFLHKNRYWEEYVEWEYLRQWLQV